MCVSIGYYQYVSSPHCISTPLPRPPLHKMDNNNNNNKLKALVIGGWSPGPLTFLQNRFHLDVEFHDITSQIPTPPIGIICWLNPYLLFIFVCVGMIPYGISIITSTQQDATVKILLVIALCLVDYLFIRKVFVPKFLKYSINHSCNVIKKALKNDHYDIVIGFSWGGAIVWWCLCQDIWSGKTMILAPTIEIMANIAKLKFPMLSKRNKNVKMNNNNNNNQQHNNNIIICIHAEDDPFTPKKQISKIQDCSTSTQQAGLIDMYECRDSHVFEQFSSEDLIEKIFIRKFLH